MEPKLKPPGIGPSLPQRLFLRYFVGPYYSKKTPLSVSRKLYESLTTKIIERAESLSPEFRKKKVLVQPILGLEDSSRYWSVDMLLEHLMIVGRHMENVILSLSNGVVPDLKVDTAKVKPTTRSTDSQCDILSEFRTFAPGLMERLDLGMKDRNSTARLPHPWFGPITARQWYWVLASHQLIHWKQLKQISSSC